MSEAQQARRALTAFRHGLRAARIAFGGDTRMLLAARRQMREGMRNPPDPSIPFDDRVQLMEDVAVFLRRNIVQGVRVDGEGGRPVYHLNIHKETELGDNVTAAGGGAATSRLGGRGSTLVREQQQQQEMDNDEDKSSRTDCCGGYGGAV